MKSRFATISRETRETSIRLELALDGTGEYDGRIGIGFLEHMLELLSVHAQINLKVEARGDLQVDDHHLTEDLGIVLGQALREALGPKEGIARYGSVLLPMDEVLVAVALDLGGRFAFYSDYRSARDKVGDLSTEMVPHFFQSLAVEAKANLHFQFLRPGENEHHRVEAMFKGFARALRMAAAVEKEGAKIPSTKGVL